MLGTKKKLQEAKSGEYGGWGVAIRNAILAIWLRQFRKNVLVHYRDETKIFFLDKYGRDFFNFVSNLSDNSR